MIGRVINNNMRTIHTKERARGLECVVDELKSDVDERLDLVGRRPGHGEPIGQSKRYYLNDRELEHSRDFCLYVSRRGELTANCRCE